MPVDFIDAPPDTKKRMVEKTGYPNGETSHRNDCYWLQRLGDDPVTGGENSLTPAADMPHPSTLLDLARTRSGL